MMFFLTIFDTVVYSGIYVGIQLMSETCLTSVINYFYIFMLFFFCFQFSILVILGIFWLWNTIYNQWRTKREMDLVRNVYKRIYSIDVDQFLEKHKDFIDEHPSN